MNQIPTQLYLASQSPRRAELLQQIGIQFEILNVSLPEIKHEHESVENFVIRLAQEKARAGLALNSRITLPVLGADTVVFCNDEVLGKPVDTSQARQMLQFLSGNTHAVMTAVTVVSQSRMESALSVSHVSMRHLEKQEIDAYLKTGEPMDKAGAYAVQGRAAAFIERIEGSYSGIMGLPLYETAGILNCFGISCL